MSFPSFFGSFSSSIFSGRDCVEIESDLTADSFDRLFKMYKLLVELY